MKPLAHIAALIVALVALGAPSLSLGMGLRVIDLSTRLEVSVSEPVAAKPWGCKALGGKRVLPCHPDLGVIAAQPAAMAPPAGYRTWRNVVLPLMALAPEAELPPPR